MEMVKKSSGTILPDAVMADTGHHAFGKASRMVGHRLNSQINCELEFAIKHQY